MSKTSTVSKTPSVGKIRSASKASPAPAAPRGPFTDAFLALLEATDDGPTAAEAESFGPWEVRQVGEHFGVFRDWERPAPEAVLEPSPSGLFVSRYHALLFAAVLGGLYADPAHHVAEKADDLGYPLLALWGERWVHPAGWLPWLEPKVAEALDVAHGLVRTPQALAHLLEAAGPTNLRLAFEILERRWREGRADPKPGSDD